MQLTCQDPGFEIVVQHLFIVPVEAPASASETKGQQL